ncbi:MAG: hypothetical protein H6867_09590 [Rhodospirillales bacterium]|nr:hypothetical protein [Rhodospirillales bacterium]MCB9995964.1 hypothetical protein [Rhodospirillales bacterium]
MALEACHNTPQEGINAAFMRNHRGEVCIAFSDPVYVRADSILVDRSHQSIHVIIHENSFFVSQVSDVMMNAFETNEHALLTAMRADGSLIELTAPIERGAA